MFQESIFEIQDMMFSLESLLKKSSGPAFLPEATPKKGCIDCGGTGMAMFPVWKYDEFGHSSWDGKTVEPKVCLCVKIS